MEKFLAYIRLMRPANILTSQADILLGFAASGAAMEIFSKEEWTIDAPVLIQLYLLLISTTLLYASGVVLNDWFDLKVDRIERPERPLPSGKANPKAALLLGISLSLLGIASAFMVSVISGIIACIIALLSLLYNKYSKHHSVWGPLNMASCRAANLTLGISVISDFKSDGLLLLIVPMIYIASITFLSQGEVNGTDKRRIETSLLLYVLLLIFILNLSFLDRFSFIYSFPFLLLFIIFSLPGLIRAMKNPDQPLLIRKAVKTSILGLILLDAALAAGFAGIALGILVTLLLPLSILLANRFAVS